MRGLVILTLTLGLATPAAAGGKPDAPGGDDPPSTGALWSANLRDYADRRLAAGDLAGAAEFYFRAYDRLAWDRHARASVGAAHEPLEQAVNVAAEAQRQDAERVDLLCHADRRLIRHAVLLGEIDGLTPEAIAVLRTARARLQGRLIAAGAVCPRPSVPGPPSIRVRTDEVRAGGDGPILDPGALAGAVGSMPVALAKLEKQRNRGRMFTRAGVGLIAAGMMTIGVGIFMAGQDRDASAALSFVAGTTGLFAGFPLLIVGDRHKRTTLALGSGGVALHF